MSTSGPSGPLGFFFTFLNWENRHGLGKKAAIFCWELGRISAPIKKGRKSPEICSCH